VARVWLVDRLRPFRLVDMPPIDAPDDLPAFVLDRSPRGQNERADAGTMAYVLWQDSVALVRGEKRGKPYQITRDVVPLGTVRAGLIAFIPTGRNADGAEVWGAVLCTDELRRKIDRPWEVERYAWETRRAMPTYGEGKVWATAWSRYCAYKKPSSRHCKQEGYFR